MNIDEIREKMVGLRKELGFTLEKSSSGFNRFALARFENGSDITLSNFIKLLDNFGHDLRLTDIKSFKKNANRL